MDAGAWMVLATVATAAVAIYAAILSTITFYKDRRDKRPHVNISLTLGILAYPGRGKAALLIQVSNPGLLPVTISSVALSLSNNRKLFMPQLDGTDRLPTELTTGQKATYWMSPHGVAETLHENQMSGVTLLWAICHDATDNEFRSKPFSFDITAHLSDED